MKITNKNDIEKFQKDLDTLGEWEVENGMKIIPGKSKAVRFTRTRFKNPLGYLHLVAKKFREQAVVSTWE